MSNEGHAVEAVFRRHGARLRRVVQRRVGPDSEEAADIVQEAGLRLMRYAHVQDEGQLQALLYRIAANLVVSRVRHRASVPPPLPLDEAIAMAGEECSPLQAVIDQEAKERLRGAVARLGPRCRDIFLMSRVEGLRQREIAQRCAVSVKAVEKHIGQALRTCRGALVEPD